MTTEDSSGPSAAPDSGVADKNTSCEHNKPENVGAQIPDGMSAQRVFKKVSPNQKLTLYLSSRDLVVSPEGIDRLQGVLLVDPEFVEDRKVYGQVTLTFRYGREDEEVMGLKFCNEAIMCLAQLYPPPSGTPEVVTPLQEALMKRLGPNAYPFNMEITPLAPPSVQLVPAKEYNGAPIGTSYDIRAYVDKVDEKIHRRSTVRMGIRVVQRAFAPPSPEMYIPGGTGRTRKQKAKQNRKALLFGCKSEPLDVKFRKNDQAKSRSAEMVAQRKETTDVDRVESATEPSWSPEASKRDITFNDEPQLAKVAFTASPNSQGQLCDNNRRHYLLSNENSAQVSSPPQMSNDIEENLEEGEIEAGIVSGESQERMKVSDDDEVSAKEDLESEKRISQYYRNLCGSKRPSMAAYLAGVPAPRAFAEKFYLLSDGQVRLTALLDKAIYSHGEDIKVTVQIQNNSNKTVKRMKVFVVQHVDVCMFSNGKFKNVVAMLNLKDDCPIHSGRTLEKTYSLVPMKSSTKNWIALEESYNKGGTSLASTVTSTLHNPDERNVFAIYVSYYVKVKLVVSMMGGEVSLKLPFTLMHTCSDTEHTEVLTKLIPDVQLELKPTAPMQCPQPVEPEKDGT